MAVTSTYSYSTTKTEFQANSFETGDQLVPNVVGLSNGGFVVAYHSGTLNTGTVEVDFYNAAHERIGTFKTPYDGAITAEDQPQVILLDNGNVLVAWRDASEGLRGHLYSQDGTAIGNEIVLSVSTGGDNLQLTALTGGGFVAVTGTGDTVYQARFNDSGVNLDAGFYQVNTPLAGDQNDGAVASLSSGGYVVTYTDTGPSDQMIRARIYNADGTTKVNDFIIGDIGDNTESSVVGLGNDRFAVVYKDTGWTGGDTGNSGITLQIFDSNGLNVTPGDYLRVNAPSLVVESDPDISVLENGFIVVSWTRQLSGTDHDIMARVYTPAGAAVTDEFVVTASADMDVNSAVSGLLSGKFVTAWQDNTSDGDGGQISAEVNELVRVTTGDGNDNSFVGDALRDDIAGLDGKDTLEGFGGDDIINGDDGNDTLYGDSGNDYLNGGSDDDRILGGDGNDKLVGGAGVNEMVGGDGDDTYVVQNAADSITEDANGGANDRIETLISYTLTEGANIEVLATNLYTDVLDFKLVGNSDDNQIVGNWGDNTIEGKGGVDKLEGLKGNDIYIVDNAADTVIELAGDGKADRVMARVDYALGKDVDIELFTTTNASGVTAIDLTGNALVQEIIGNAGVNTLKDGGGAGDTLRGMAGDDTYLVYSAATQIVEGSSQGAADKVMSNVDFTLGAGVYVEQLATTNSNGNAAIDLTGNDLAQEITGNAGQNILKDGGGVADVMKGLGGDDTYIIYAAGTEVIEGAGQGTGDKVLVNVDFVLSSTSQVEHLATTSGAGKAVIDLTGNSFAQDITGNATSNRIDGKGGHDTLNGLGGTDTFVFSATIGAANIDTVADFSAAADTVELENAIFTKLTVTGALANGNFRANASGVALDANDHIVYETDTGKLFYDADGNGAGAAIQFAVLTGNPAITAADFVVA
ncbi:calcium-binding protein [Mesorhizobium sp. ASY16-5R]|uniref:calcium-binding protein n=1 Tax=Mesorhizobium sp. ASY16-5R TaxID=3445772 RepID=UPI003FA1481F